MAGSGIHTHSRPRFGGGAFEVHQRKSPEKFLEDLSSARNSLPSAGIMEAKNVPRKGVVSFVDELIYHATPLVGRHLSAKDLYEFVKDKWYLWYQPASNFREELRTTKSKDEFNMDQVRDSALGLTHDEIEQLFAKYSACGNRATASIPGGRDETGREKTGVKPTISGSGRPALTRRMSKRAKKGSFHKNCLKVKGANFSGLG